VLYYHVILVQILSDWIVSKVGRAETQIFKNRKIWGLIAKEGSF
jgi:hypothetical protein